MLRDKGLVEMTSCKLLNNNNDAECGPHGANSLGQRVKRWRVGGTGGQLISHQAFPAHKISTSLPQSVYYMPRTHQALSVEPFL